MSRAYEIFRQLDIATSVSAEPLGNPDADGSPGSDLVSAEKSDAVDDEMSRLVQTMFFAGNPRAPRRLVFCGVDEANGSSIVCANAGRALAARRQSVCLVDANARLARLSRMLGFDDDRTYMKAPGRDRCVQVGTHLWLAGPHMVTDDAGNLLSVTELKLLFGKLQGLYGIVLIDVPGVSTSRDAAILGQLADAAVLVVEANNTRKVAARKAKESLEGAGVQLIGTVLNNRSYPIPERLYRKL